MQRLWMFLLVSAFLLPLPAWASDQLTMVYRTTPKPPFIGGAPDHEGIWKQAFEKAAHKIGMTLEVVRLPKRRAYQELAVGTVDFYPAASFQPERAEFGFYIDNKIGGAGILVAHHASQAITAAEDIIEYDLLVNLGNTTRFYRDAGIDLQRNNILHVAELDTQRALELVRLRGDAIYAYTDVSIETALQQSGSEEIRTLAVSYQEPISYLLFSKASPHYAERPNPDYDPQQQHSITNLPYRLDQGSVAYKFRQALRDLKQGNQLPTSPF